jgi:tyrosyl-DNA phosphodiesterase-1
VYSKSAFHPKMILVKFDDRLRVIIGSGNLAEPDWSIWDNIWWMKDFPKVTEKVTTPFSTEISEFLKFTLADKYDFVMNFLGFEICDYKMIEDQASLVCSLPGRWKSGGDSPMSYQKFWKILEVFKPVTKFTLENMKVVYVSSSVSLLTEKLLSDFAQGFIRDQRLAKRGPSSAKKLVAEKISVLFPSRGFVKSARGGVPAEGCLFLDKNKFDSPKFQRAAFKSYKIHDPDQETLESVNSFVNSSEEKKRVPHMKVSVITNSGVEINDDTIIYLGSHNFTKAAWGQLELEETQVSIQNYELGVVFPPLAGSAAAKRILFRLIGIDLSPIPFNADEPNFR